LKKIDSWNYRVVEVVQNNQTFYELHEVYYTGEKDNSEISSMTVEPPECIQDTVEDLKQDLEYRMQAFDRPILKMSEINALFSDCKDDCATCAKEESMVEDVDEAFANMDKIIWN